MILNIVLNFDIGVNLKIKIYTTPSCPYCLLAKQYFQSKKIIFEEIDVSKSSQKAQEMVDLSGQMGVPVITIDDKVIIGFDKEKIESILKQ